MGALEKAQSDLKAQEALIVKEPTKAGPTRRPRGVRELQDTEVPTPKEFIKQFSDHARFYYGDIEDFGYDFPFF